MGSCGILIFLTLLGKASGNRARIIRVIAQGKDVDIETDSNAMANERSEKFYENYKSEKLVNFFFFF